MGGSANVSMAYGPLQIVRLTPGSSNQTARTRQPGYGLVLISNKVTVMIATSFRQGKCWLKMFDIRLSATISA